MTNISNIFLSVIITFFITLALNSFVQWITLADGVVIVGPTTNINQNEFFTFQIENYSKKPINELILLVPAEVDVKRIHVSTPLSIVTDKNSQGAPNQKRIFFSGFPAREITSVYIPMTSITDVDLFKFENLLAKELTKENFQNRRSPFREIILTVLLNALISSIILGFFLFFQRHSMLKLLQELSRLDNRLEKQEETLRKHETSGRKMRLLLLARLSDYAKELSFWRDTIRRVIYTSGSNKDRADTVIREVQKSLKTYRADLMDFEHFETIKMAANIMRGDEESLDTNISPKDSQ